MNDVVSHHPTASGEATEETKAREALERTLQEYNDSMPDVEGEGFRQRLAGDPVFHTDMMRTLAQMATLIGVAATQDDDVLFNKLRKKVLFESGQDSPDAHALRQHYLEGRASAELLELMPTGAMRRRFEERMGPFHREFLARHSVRR